MARNKVQAYTDNLVHIRLIVSLLPAEIRLINRLISPGKSFIGFYLEASAVPENTGYKGS